MIAKKFRDKGVTFDEVYLDAPENKSLSASFKDRGMMSTPILEEPGVGIWVGLQPKVLNDIVERHGTK